jgi:hypothetical protein
VRLAQEVRDLEVGDTKRLRSLESENARLKKLLAERDLEIEVMKEIAAKMVSAEPTELNFSKQQSLLPPDRCVLIPEQQRPSDRSRNEYHPMRPTGHSYNHHAGTIRDRYSNN